jgi:hypothetical protein
MIESIVVNILNTMFENLVLELIDNRFENLCVERLISELVAWNMLDKKNGKKFE